MHQLKKKGILLFVGLLLTINILTIIGGKEFFPFSINPMFGHYITSADTLYHIDFVLVKDTTRQKINFDKLGLFEMRFKRFYFSNIYGSSEQGSPQGYFQNESVEDFEKRNKDFFSELTTLLSREYNMSDYQYIDLIIESINAQDSVLETRLIGRFDIKSQNFQHVFKYQ